MMESIACFMKRLTEDGYDLEIEMSNKSFRFTTYTGPLRVTRIIPIDVTLTQMASIFWDISSTIKKLERKYGR
jgi:hypothetical protein